MFTPACRQRNSSRGVRRDIRSG